MSRYVSPVETITDLNGAPMVGAKLVFYATGTATPKTIYSDSGLSVPMTNPVTAVSSGAGAIYPDIYLDGIYKVVQQDDSGTAGVADGVVLWTRDPVGDVTTGNFEAWLNDSTYNIPEVVYASNDKYYISLVDANQGNEPSASPAQWKESFIKDGAFVNGDATEPFSASTLVDSNGNEVIIPAGSASAVNELTVTNAATGNAVGVSATGGDTNISVSASGKGTGKFNIDGNAATATYADDSDKLDGQDSSAFVTGVNGLTKGAAFSSIGLGGSTAQVLSKGVWNLSITSGTNVWVEVQAQSGVWKQLQVQLDANNAKQVTSDGVNVRVHNRNAGAVTVYTCKIFS